MRLLRLLLEKPRAYLVVPFFLRLSISTSRSTKFHFFLRRQKKFLLFFTLYIIMATLHAGVMELVDVVDSKSTASDGVPVRVRPPAPCRSKLCIACSDIFTKSRSALMPLLLLSKSSPLRWASVWFFAGTTTSVSPLIPNQ